MRLPPPNNDKCFLIQSSSQEKLDAPSGDGGRPDAQGGKVLHIVVFHVLFFSLVFCFCVCVGFCFLFFLFPVFGPHYHEQVNFSPSFLRLVRKRKNGSKIKMTVQGELLPSSLKMEVRTIMRRSVCNQFMNTGYLRNSFCGQGLRVKR